MNAYVEQLIHTAEMVGAKAAQEAVLASSAAERLGRTVRTPAMAHAVHTARGAAELVALVRDTLDILGLVAGRSDTDDVQVELTMALSRAIDVLAHTGGLATSALATAAALVPA
jgi:hypothetical protein